MCIRDSLYGFDSSTGKSSNRRPSIPTLDAILIDLSNPRDNNVFKYAYKTIGISDDSLILEMQFMTPSKVEPELNALKEASWFTLPSANGSENGRPSSMISTPTSSKYLTISTVNNNSGSQPVI